MEHLNKRMGMQVRIFVAFYYLLMSNCVKKTGQPHHEGRKKFVSPGHQNIKSVQLEEENE
jgi:hypothetical protein